MGTKAEGEEPSKENMLEERAKDRKSAQSESDELSRPGLVRGSSRVWGALLGGQVCRRGSNERSRQELWSMQSSRKREENYWWRKLALEQNFQSRHQVKQRRRGGRKPAERLGAKESNSVKRRRELDSR